MELTEQQIEEINGRLENSWNEGIYTEPWGTVNCKGKKVIYQRINTGGYSGGSCWGTESERYENDCSGMLEKWEALDETLCVLKPDIKYLEYRRIMNKLVKTNECTDSQYYGNCDDYHIRWIVLDELLEFIENL